MERGFGVILLLLRVWDAMATHQQPMRIDRIRRTSDERDQILAGLNCQLFGIGRPVGTSKTFRSLARLCGAVMRAPGREDSWIMTREQLEDWIPRLAAIAPEQRVALPGITPERTMQIVGGGVVADEIMKALNIQEVEICPWALREGAILRWLDQFGRTRLGF